VDPAKVLETLVKACNQKSSKELFPLCTKEVQKQLPSSVFDTVLREVNAKYGAFSWPLPKPREETGGRVYRIRGTRQPFALRVSFSPQGYLAGLNFRPAFLDDLPAGPLFIEEVQGRLRDAVEQSLHVYQVPSISLALVKGDRLVWTHAF